MMVSEEQTRILQMVADGTITPAEAGDLLAALEKPRPSPAQPSSFGSSAATVRPAAKRTLVIQIIDGEETKVNIRIPLGLARAASKFIPRNALAYLEDHDIDLEAFMEGMNSDNGDNTLLEVRDGESYVRIAVE
jgi:SHOCT-like domain